MHVRRLVPLTIALATCAAASGCVRKTAAPGAQGAAPVVAADSSEGARIARITAGLRRGMDFTSRAPERWSLAERMARYHVPGVSIAVIDHGRIAWARGFGVVQAGTTDSVTAATLFQAASISKPVAQTAMLRLVERGTLDLDTDVNRYLTSWKLPENGFTATEKVTLRRIASHSAGLTVNGFPGYATTDAIPTVVQVLNGEKPANTGPIRADTFPGAIGRYSGGGTTVEQQLLVDVTGKPFPALMQELVLGPARMTHSTYEQPLPASRAGEASRAHDAMGSPIPGGWHVYPEMAPAGLWTTPSDLATWAIAIADSRAGKPNALLRQSTAVQMLTEVKDGYGIGPALGGSGRTFWFGHNGANEGFRAGLVMFPEAGVGAVMMTNGENGMALIGEVMYAIAAEYGWPGRQATTVTTIALDTMRASGLVGAYQLRDRPVIVANVTRAGASLMLRAPQLPDEELVALSDTSFMMSPIGWTAMFARDASGRATGLRMVRPQGPTLEWTRQP